MADDADTANGVNGADGLLPAYLRKQASQPKPLTGWWGTRTWGGARVLLVAGSCGVLLLVLLLVATSLFAR